jgi:putative flippase GtrA
VKKLWNWALGMYRKYQEGIDYLFWGGVAFVLSMVLFYIFANVMMIEEQIANVITWIICVIFTYFTNRIFVFKSKTSGTKAIIKEFTEFTSARLATLVLENVVLFICIDLLLWHNMIAKLIGQFLVIVSNYVLSKLWIFKKKDKE